ncbi:MAG: sulfatase-like hydrolase/transferase [Fuerstiella sp.]
MRISCLTFVIAVLSCLPPAESARAARPNLLVILADDLGYGDLACCGAADMQTPHLDALFSRGMRFTSFYANCPVCSPTRAALLSGRYQELVGVPGVIRTHPENSWGYLAPQATLLPAVAQKAGYHTAIVGKWHLGLETPNTPLERGFDHFHGFLGDMMDDYYNHRRHGHNYMYRDRTEIDPPGHATDLFTQWSVDYLNNRRDTDQPFLLYLAYNAPHTPIQPPQDWEEKVVAREPGISRARARLVALIEHMDAGIGRVLAALQANGQAENTIIVFTSDNGGQLNVGANNGPLRDGKQSVYEGGLKVPAAVVWEGQIRPGSVTPFRALSMDILPTLFEAAGIEIEHSVEGQSFLKTLRREVQPELRKQWFFCRREGGLRYGGKTIDAVIEGPWKLLQNSPWEGLELYNLDSDPAEQHNLIDQHPGVVNRLNAAMRLQQQRGGRIPWQPPQS